MFSEDCEEVGVDAEHDGGTSKFDDSKAGGHYTEHGATESHGGSDMRRVNRS